MGYYARKREREREKVCVLGGGSSQIVDGVGSMLVTGPPDPGVALTHPFADLWLGVVSTDFYRGQKLSADCVVKNLPKQKEREVSFYPLSSAACTQQRLLLLFFFFSFIHRTSIQRPLPPSLFFRAFITRPSIYTRLGRRHVRDAIALIAMHR